MAATRKKVPRASLRAPPSPTDGPSRDLAPGPAGATPRWCFMTAAADPSPPTHAPAREAVAAAVYYPVKDLRAWGQNYRRNHRVVELARTILRTRWGAPIVAQRSTRRIIGGHGRSFAAMGLAPRLAA